jgi:RHS repeat-associated protein
VQDAATGLTYMQQRYYDPLLGRFLSVDPVTAYENPINAFNAYWYASGSPYRFFDPDGRQAADGRGCGDKKCPEPPPNPEEQIPSRREKAEQRNQERLRSQGWEVTSYEPLYCSGGADCDFMYNQNEYVAGRITSDEFTDRTVAQGAGGTAGAVAGLGIASGPEGWVAIRQLYQFIKLGREISVGKNFRFAPFGNRTGHKFGRWPHYHRRGRGASGETRPGQGIGRHRPLEKKSTDNSFWDRF